MGLAGTWMLRQAAWLAERAGGHAAARRCWERIGALAPGDPAVLLAVSVRRARAGDTGAAIAACDEALAIDPSRADAWFNLGFLLQLDGRHEEAVNALARATGIDPRLDRAWYGMGLSLAWLGRLDAAIEAMERTTELQPVAPYGWYQLVHLHHRRGERRRVARTIRRIAGFEPALARRLERETGVRVRTSGG